MGKISSFVSGSNIVTSTDGLNWVLQSSGTSVSLRAITYGNGQFIAVGGDYEPFSQIVVTSRDGQTWFRQKSVSEVPLTSIAYGGGYFVVNIKS